MFMHLLRPLCIAPLVIALSGTCVAGASPWRNCAAVTDEELTNMRGGVLLPDGLDVDIGIDIQTEVNGVLVLHTVLSTAAPSAQALRVFVGGTAPSNGGSTKAALNTVPPMLTLDRSGASTTLVTSAAPLNPTIVVLNAPTNVWPQYPDETQLNVVPNGPAVQTPNGNVQVQQAGANTAVTLTGNGITVSQLLGDATGTVVSNQLNNQSIQSMTVVDVDLHGSWPAIANAMFNIGKIAVSAVRRP
jgi:hypothetical protein